MAGHDKQPQNFSLDPVRLVDIGQPDFVDPNKPSDNNKRIAETILKLNRGEVILAAGQYAYLAASEATPSAYFEEDPEFGVGREQSRQGVMFGRLDVQTSQHPTITTFAALKPYDKRVVDFKMKPSMAVTHEWATNLHMRRLSAGSAYEPIGVWRRDVPYVTPGLITRFNERSRSLDTVLRATTESDAPIDAVTEERVRHAMHLGHFGLGIAHGAHIIHGDALPQNFAVDGSRIIFNDTTFMRPFGKDDKVTQARMNEDAADFIGDTVDPQKTSPQIRALTNRVLKDEDFRGTLYDAYARGAAQGAERSGYPKSGLLISQETHQQIIDDVVEDYLHRKTTER